MKICHVLWSLTYGGIETMVVNIANEQSCAGHTVCIVVINDNISADLSRRLDPTVELVALRRPAGSGNPLYPLMLNWALLRRSPDIVHFHFVNIPRLVFKPLMKRWCTTYHTTYRPEFAPFFKDNRKLFAISPEVRRSITAGCGMDSEVITNGIETAKFKHREKDSSHGRFHIVQVGRLNYVIKGQDILLEAVSQLVSEGADIDLTFIGEGDNRVDIEQFVAENALGDRVMLAGAKTQEYLYRHLSDYDLLVQPSRIEGFGLTAAEAMAAGVPVAVSDCPALVEVVDGGRCGTVFSAGSSESCAAAIRGIIAAPEHTRNMAECARERVKSLYDVSATAAAYVEAYSRL